MILHTFIVAFTVTSGQTRLAAARDAGVGVQDAVLGVSWMAPDQAQPLTYPPLTPRVDNRERRLPFPHLPSVAAILFTHSILPGGRDEALAFY